MPTKYLVLRAQAPLVPTLEVFGVTARVPEGNELSIVAIPGHEYDTRTLRRRGWRSSNRPRRPTEPART